MSAEADRCCLELKRWHPLHFLTKSLASSKVVGKKNPWQKALATRDLEAAWWPHSPWWMSLRIALPFSGSTQRRKTPVTLRLTSSPFTIVYADARRCTCRARISSAGSSPLTRKLRIGWAHDGASTTVITATGTRAVGLGDGGLELAAACCVVEVPGPTAAARGRVLKSPGQARLLQSPGRLPKSPGRLLQSPGRVRLLQSPDRLPKSPRRLLQSPSRIRLFRGQSARRWTLIPAKA